MSATVAYLHGTRSIEWRVSGEERSLLASYLSSIVRGDDDHLHLFGSPSGEPDFTVPPDGEFIASVLLSAVSPVDDWSDSGHVYRRRRVLELYLTMARIAEIRDFLASERSVLEVGLDEHRLGTPWEKARRWRAPVPLRAVRFIIDRLQAAGVVAETR